MRRRFAALAVLVVLLVACERAPDEDIIREHLDAMTAALADGNARAFVGPLAEDFSTVNGGLDRRGARLLVQREVMARERVRVRLIDPEISLRGDDRAVATFHALATGGSGLIPDDARLWRVETGWRRSGNDWEMISAEWEPVAGR